MAGGKKGNQQPQWLEWGNMQHLLTHKQSCELIAGGLLQGHASRGTSLITPLQGQDLDARHQLAVSK